MVRSDTMETNKSIKMAELTVRWRLWLCIMPHGARLAVGLGHSVVEGIAGIGLVLPVCALLLVRLMRVHQ